MQQNTRLTKDQFTKLGCDAHACFELALMAEAHINENKVTLCQPLLSVAQLL